MAAKSTLPEPWLRLAEILGGVAQLAAALGTQPRVVNQWAHSTRNPSGPSRALIRLIFDHAGIPSPV